MVCLALFSLNVKVGSGGNEAWYYGALSFFIIVISKNMFICYLTLLEFLWFLGCFIVCLKTYLQCLDLQMNG